MRSLVKILRYVFLILLLLVVTGISMMIGSRPFLGAKARNRRLHASAASSQVLRNGIIGMWSAGSEKRPSCVAFL